VASVLAVVFLDRSFEVSISFICAHLRSLGAHPHQPQSGTCQQRSDKEGFRYFTLGFTAKMRLERNPVCSFSRESALTRFIVLLLRRRGHDRID
jgi:hypothetical protein